MRVLLTGAAGFIGSRVDAALRAAGHDVVGVDVLLPAAHGPKTRRTPSLRSAHMLARYGTVC
ncbi:NAD-dependent epimerase/dehydratase family protein, partial [Mycobacterium sp. E2238]|uniref:NAD-dependent epimerase/dehydratase family protein n=1 Tax=Mycobacterium sp. E2238 TaxID=1834131 RepID=UPI000A410633